MIKNFTPSEIKKLLESGSGFRLIDVREKWEYDLARIEGAELIPLGDFVPSSGTLNKNERLILYCHKGVRSMSACNYLMILGYEEIYNLKGGIDAWSLEVDESVPRY